MDASSWTREENVQFKNALQLFSAFLPTRFESIAQYLKKSVLDVMEHYQEMVDDLLKMGSSQIALPAEPTEAIAQSLYPVEGTRWTKEEHEWFLIGSKRFGTDWEKLADLLDSKNPMQVAIYARNYFHWQSAKRNVMKRRRANDITMLDINVDTTGHQESLFHPQQGEIALEMGHHAWTPNYHIFHDRMN